MKTIKIFVASSNELKSERDAFDVLVNQFNSQFRHKAIFIELVKWENLDASMGEEHKQTEYNNKLKECDLCVVLFWKKYGEYTESELLKAYERFSRGEKPYKLHVYFKNAAISDLSEDLELFKDSFNDKYGNLGSNFQNIDTMRLNFLLHLYNHKVIEEGALSVENEAVIVDDCEYVRLSEVPFAANNDQFKDLKIRLGKVNTDILKYRQKYEETHNEAFAKMLNKSLALKIEIEEKFDKLQKSLFNTALVITSMYGKRSSARLRLAIEKFESGDSIGANAILDPNEIEADARAIIESYKRGVEMVEVALNSIRSSIEELLLKVKIAEKDNYNSVSVDDCIICLDKACILAREVNLPQEETVLLMGEYVSFLVRVKMYSDAISKYIYIVSSLVELSNIHPEQYLQELAETQETLGGLYSKVDDSENSRAIYTAALNSYTTLTCDYNIDCEERINKLADLI